MTDYHNNQAVNILHTSLGLTKLDQTVGVTNLFTY